MKTAFITNGFGPQMVSFNDYRLYLDTMIYLPYIKKVNLSQFSAVIIPDHVNIRLLMRHSDKINDYVRKGGFLVVFGDSGLHKWFKLLNLKWKAIFANDWRWWEKKNGRLKIYYPNTNHSIQKIIPISDMSWHYHGVFDFVDGAVPILNLDNDKGCILFDYFFENNSRLIASTLDPFMHNGDRYMPATTRFLNNFFPWFKKEISDREK